MKFALDFDELTGYNNFLAEAWKKYLQANPTVLEMPCDIAGMQNARGLIKHIWTVEFRYAEQLNGRRPPEYEELADTTLEDLWNIRERAAASMREFLAATADAALDQTFEVKTKLAGVLSTTRRVIFVHAMTHSMRHWAQLSTLARQAGYPALGFQDYLFYKLGR